MYSMMIIVTNTVLLYIRVSKRVHPKSFQHTVQIVTMWDDDYVN